MRRIDIAGKDALNEELGELWDAIGRLRMNQQAIGVGEVVAGTPGPQGERGPAGAQGPAGPAGPQGEPAQNFVYEQAVAAAVWTINHNLSRYPQVTVVDSAGTTVEGGVEYNSLDTITITFSAPFAGRAFLGG